MAESKVKEHLKYPLTASFNGASVFKTGGMYIVEGNVTAENGFGVPSSMKYTLYFTDSNGSYEFSFGEIDGEIIG